MTWCLLSTEERARENQLEISSTFNTTERLHFHFSLSCIGEGNGNPLQCSCLENPRDRRACWAAVYGVAQSRTRLKRLSSSSSSSSSNNQHIDTWPVHGVHLITSESPGRCYWPYLWFHQLDEPQHPQALFQSLWRIQQLLPFWHLHKTRQWKNKDFKISNFELNKRLSQIPNGFTQEAPRIRRSKEVKFSPNLW